MLGNVLGRDLPLGKTIPYDCYVFDVNTPLLLIIVYWLRLGVRRGADHTRTRPAAYRRLALLFKPVVSETRGVGGVTRNDEVPDMAEVEWAEQSPRTL